MIKRIELLVHAGAPSSRKDDDKYKALADAYLAFDGTRITNTSKAPASSGTHPSQNEHLDQTTVVESPTVFLDDTQLAITALDSQLATSSIPVPSGRVHAPIESVGYPRNDDLPVSERAQSILVSSPPSRITHDGLLAQIRSFGKRKLDYVVGDHGQALADAPQPLNVCNEVGPLRTSTTPDALSLSSYLKTPILHRTTKKPRLHGPDLAGKRPSSAPVPPLATFAALGQEQSDAMIAEPTSAAPAAVIARPAPADPPAVAQSQASHDVSEPTSELPTSYSLSDLTSESSRARNRISQRSVSDPGPNNGRGEQKSSGNRDASTASEESIQRSLENYRLAARRSRKAPQPAQPPEVIVIPNDTQPKVANGKSSTSNVTDPAPGTHNDAVTATSHKRSGVGVPPRLSLHIPTEKALGTLQTLASTIRPKEPDIGIDDFETHVTHSLASLASNSDLKDCYKPSNISREVRALERGYWLVECAAWSLQAQIDFWLYLAKTIEPGIVGWGVWCSRERTCADGPGQSATIGTVKVFCWGEVVKHIYLVLYVASKSQVRRLGVQWIDAKGEVVVQMRKA